MSHEMEQTLCLRPLDHILNFLHIIWFGALIYFRFKDSGRACSGDFIGLEKPKNFTKLYIWEEGRWILIYCILQVLLVIYSKIISLSKVNKLYAQIEEREQMQVGAV